MAHTLAQKAVVGRRIAFTYYRDLKLAQPPAHPGIITSVTEDKASLRIRLDGKRYNLAARTDYQGITYLDEVVPVPVLPMGRFIPTGDDLLGVWEGVPLSTIGEDGEDLILLAADRDKAVAAAQAYDREVGVHPDSANYDRIRAFWAVFEWEPEDAETPWTVRWDAAEGDEKAVRIHYLPA